MILPGARRRAGRQGHGVDRRAERRSADARRRRRRARARLPSDRRLVRATVAAHGRAGRGDAAHLVRRAAVRRRRSRRAAAGTGGRTAADRRLGRSQGARPCSPVGGRRRRSDDDRQRLARGRGRRAGAHPRRLARRRAAPTRRTPPRASGTRSGPMPPTACARYVGNYMRIMGDPIADYMAGAAERHTSEALREAVAGLRRRRLRRADPRADHVRSRRARPAPATPSASDAPEQPGQTLAMRSPAVSAAVDAVSVRGPRTLFIRCSPAVTGA